MGYHTGNDLNGVTTRIIRSNEAELVGIYEISKLLASPDRIEKTFASVLALLSSFLDMRDGLITLLDERCEPEVVIGPGCSEAGARQFFDHLAQPAVRRIVATKMPLVIENVADSPLFEGSDLSEWGPDESAPFSILGVPIKEGDAVVGVLTVDRLLDAQTCAPFDHDLRFLAMVANLLGQTLRLHKLVDKDRKRLMQENARLEDNPSNNVGSKLVAIPGILGESEALRAVVEKIRIVAKAKSTVLLRG